MKLPNPPAWSCHVEQDGFGKWRYTITTETRRWSGHGHPSEADARTAAIMQAKSKGATIRKWTRKGVRRENNQGA
jgi:hypothetical protein